MKKTAHSPETSLPATIVTCPQCGAAVVWTSASRWKPFCSERCKLLDLGAWANESYRITGAEAADISEMEEIERALTAPSADIVRPH
ncbi:MAG: DNA gyrase inhibitor YacG [Burkholderiales bacterium]|jgi:endogenous inhibitor of DNA gyrase (YacG/DUF329 family)|nr:DNA gyrase inhibitor YacG [Burkholderiales bacterium]